MVSEHVQLGVVQFSRLFFDGLVMTHNIVSLGIKLTWLKYRSCKVLTLIASVWLPVDLRKNLELGTQKVEKWVFAFFNTLQSLWINANNLGSLKCNLGFNLISRWDLACGPSHLSYLVAHAFFNSLVHHWELHIWIRKCIIHLEIHHLLHLQQSTDRSVPTCDSSDPPRLNCPGAGLITSFETR